MTAIEVVKKFNNVITEEQFWETLSILQNSDEKIMIEYWEESWLVLSLAAKLATFRKQD